MVFNIERHERVRTEKPLKDENFCEGSDEDEDHVTMCDTMTNVSVSTNRSVSSIESRRSQKLLSKKIRAPQNVSDISEKKETPTSYIFFYCQSYVFVSEKGNTHRFAGGERYELI
jgi:hypothetical protein